MVSVSLYLGVIVCLAFQIQYAAGGEALIEPQRQAEYEKRQYSWPPEVYIPDTPGWKAVMKDRFTQLEEMDYDTQRRYEGFYQLVHPALLAQNYTEYGFGLARCPEGLLKDMQKGIHDGLPTAKEEVSTASIYSPHLRPLFIDRRDLTGRILKEIKPYVEAWAGIPLQGHQCYGFRLYRNESQLYMHVDRMQTHVLSFILHIDSSDDAEPWPIFIEDFHGRTHEVILTPGDILFYESSKCFHGRPRPFKGSWYTSVFAHYYPLHGWQDVNHELESHYRVPPIWSKPFTGEERTQPKLEMVETTMKEPDCPDVWCHTQDTIKWSGPGEEGHWIAPSLEKFPLKPRPAGEDEL